MPTADRTTFGDAMEALLAALRSGLIASPPTVSKPFRAVIGGDARADSFARPHLAARPTSIRSVDVTDGDRIFEIETALTVTADASEDDGHVRIASLIGAIEDVLDAAIPAGIDEGTDVGDGRTWRIEPPREVAGVRMTSASATLTLVVRVERDQNRVAAP